MKKSIFYWLLLSSFIACAMEKPLEKEACKSMEASKEAPKKIKKKLKKRNKDKQPSATVTLAYDQAQHTLSLSDAHIFTYHLERDPQTNVEKFVGLHHYNLNKAPRKLEKGQVVEINNHLWIFIPQGMDTTKFHCGYPIYNGTWYPKKTFFPSNWSRERVLNSIKSQVEEKAKNVQAITWQKEGTQKFIGYCPLKNSNSALKLIIKCYPPDRHVLISVFPLDAHDVTSHNSKAKKLDPIDIVVKRTTLSSKKSTLNSLAVEQLRGLQEKSAKKIPIPALTAAVQSNNHAEVITLLKNNADANIRTEQGCTPLMIAAKKGDYEIMRELIDYGALIFENGAYLKDKRGMSILEYALQSWNEFAVLPLLKHAEVTDQELIRTYTQALIKALEKLSSDPVEKISTEVIHLLLSYGADPNMPDENGYTPLMRVAKLNGLNNERLLIAHHIMTLLLDHGAQIDAINKETSTTRIKGCTALLYAAESGYTQLVRKLLEAGADCKIVNSQGKNAAVVATHKGQLAAAAEINAYEKEITDWIKNNKANDLIYWSFKNNLDQMKKVVMKKVVQINQINNVCNDGASALSYAVKNNNYDAVNFLLSNGADPRNDDNSLYDYVQNNHSIDPAIKLLVADYYEQLNKGEYAKKYVLEQQKQRIIERFKHEVSQNELTEKTVLELKKLGIVTVEGVSPLIYAIQKLAPKAVKVLCTHKVLEGQDPLSCVYALICKPETETHATQLLEILIHCTAGSSENIQHLFERIMQDRRFEILDLIKDIPHFWFALLTNVVLQRNNERVAQICKRNVFITHEQAATCIAKAIELGALDCITTLLHYYPSTKNYQNSKGLSLLHLAAQSEQAEIFDYLCKEVDVTLEDCMGRTAGDMIAADKRYAKVMHNAFTQAYSQKKRADEAARKIHEREKFKDLPACLVAVTLDDPDAIKKLTPQEVVWKNEKQQTLLMIALGDKKKKALNALLERPELEINAQDENGWTALHHAIKEKDISSIEKFLGKNARLDISDKQEKTVLDIPCISGVKKILKDMFVEQIDAFLENANNATSEKISLITERILKLDLNDSQKGKIAQVLCKKAKIAILDALVTADKKFLAVVTKIIKDHRLKSIESAEPILAKSSSEIITDALPSNRNPLLDKAFIDFILKNKILLAEEMLSFAIVTNNKDAVEYIIQTNPSKKSWPARVENSQVLTKLYAENETILKEMSCICFASTLNRIDIVKLLLQKPHDDINLAIHPATPFWIFLLHQYKNDTEIIDLIRHQHLEIRYIPKSDVEKNLAFFQVLLSKKFYFPLKFLLEHETISKHITTKKLSETEAFDIANRIFTGFVDNSAIPTIIELIKLRPGILQAPYIAQKAIVTQAIELFKALYSSQDIIFTNKDKTEMLFEALAIDDALATALILEDETYDINHWYQDYTPLMKALQLGYPLQIIEQFLKKPGINIHKANAAGETAICVARSPQMLDLIRSYDKAAPSFSQEMVLQYLAKGKELLKDDQQEEAQGMFNRAYYNAYPTPPQEAQAAYLQAHASAGLADLAVQADDLYGTEEIQPYIRKAKELLELARKDSSLEARIKNLEKVIELIEKKADSLLSDTPIPKGKKSVAMNEPAVKPKLALQGKKVELESAMAAFELGMTHMEGNGCPKNFEKAYLLFQKALKLGTENKDLQAGVWLALGQIYSAGDRYLEKNMTKALFCYKKAADQEVNKSARYHASYIIGKQYMQEPLRNHELALKYLHYVADTEEFTQFKAAAQRELGLIYCAEKGVAKDMSKTIKYWQAAHNQKSDLISKKAASLALEALKEKAASIALEALKEEEKTAAIRKAFFYEGINCWTKAQYESAQQNFLTTYSSTTDQTIKNVAELFLGIMCMHGQGCSLDFTKARDYFYRILKLIPGDEKTIELFELENLKKAILVKFLQEGESNWDNQHYEKRAIFEAVYHLSADPEAEAIAANYLGTMHEKGDQYSISYVKAKELFEQASKLSTDGVVRATALWKIANIYEIQNDQPNAVVYYRKAVDACDHGWTRYEACYKLAMKLKDGKGIPRDYELAREFFMEVEKSTQFSNYKASAQLWLGFLYTQTNAPKDSKEGKNYLLEAAKQDNDEEAKQAAIQALKNFEHSL